MLMTSRKLELIILSRAFLLPFLIRRARSTSSCAVSRGIFLISFKYALIGSILFLFILQRRLSGSQTRDRHAIRRAGHIIHAGFVAKLDTLRLTAVLTANAHLEVFF